MLKSKNDYPEYPIWRAISRRAKIAAGFRCQICGHKKSEEENDSHVTVHHLDGDKANNNERNLVVICWICHKKIQQDDPQKVREYVDSHKDKYWLNAIEKYCPMSGNEFSHIVDLKKNIGRYER